MRLGLAYAQSLTPVCEAPSANVWLVTCFPKVWRVGLNGQGGEETTRISTPET